MKQVCLKNGDAFPSLIRGIWQLSEGHQTQRCKSGDLAPLQDSLDKGMNTFDCADIYLGAESLLGELRQCNPSQSVRVHTKYVPDLENLDRLKLEDTEAVINRSLFRLKSECLDLVQFHWWDYRHSHYLEALSYLFELKRKGKIRAVGVTNFCSSRLEEVLRAGFDIASIQLQVSLVDKRGQRKMRELCKAHGIRMLGYGSLLGGFLSERWIGQAEPAEETLLNRSLVKYKLIIDDWGGWARFQEFLTQMDGLARKYRVSMSQLAVQAVLHGGLADAAIVGLSPSRFEDQNRDLLNEFSFDPKDLGTLLSWDCPLEGDVYELERGERHSKIMRMNQNRVRVS